MLDTAVFILGTLAPLIAVIGTWIVLRRRRVWVRALVLLGALLISLPLGGLFVFVSTDGPNGEHTPAGLGVAWYPLANLWVVVFVATIIALAVDALVRVRRRPPTLGGQ
jgi:hypothetical protein